MHGRLKVKTTAEKQAEKNKEREKKKLVYQKCMRAIKDKFNSGDRSMELLGMITKVLENIPEFSTLWNWRRVILLAMISSSKEEIQKSEHENESETKSSFDKSEMLSSEKSFVAKCLEVNPKAYSLWSHRRWLVEQNATESVIQEELNLCNLFLKYDERNFHCWDYRRYIVRLGGITREAELETSTTLIERNFSNYSAWHYRTTLLDTNNVDTVRQELEWAQNAYFTDPSDQSVWLYYQWLLGRETKPDKLLTVLRDGDNSTIHVLLNNISYNPPSNLKVILHDGSESGVWKSHVTPSRLWYCDISTPPEHEVTVQLGSETVRCVSDIGVTLDCITPRVDYTAPRDIVQEQLGNIRDLYELEPENKWVISTYLDMMNTCNQSKSKEQITEMRNLTVKLCHVDPMRTGYYRDLWTKLLCETAVTAWWSNVSRDAMTSRDMMTSREPLNLSKKYLTRLDHADYMCALRELDISHNNITSLSGFTSLVSLTSLNLSHNKIPSLDGLESCKNLTVLDASFNCINNSCAVLACAKCRLQELTLEGNPLATSEVYPGCVVQCCSMLCKLDNREL